ncbi:acyl-CoA carboxylase subunit beta [Pseudoduganella ginsengisoli]|nr:acyl-CoA carboxylase subunit beta [Pseudoduganella ginsengisoli]
MKVETTVDPASGGYRANHDAVLAQLAQLRALEQRTRDKSNAARPLFERRGQLLPRERLAHLLDTGAPFLELSTLAGYGLDHPDLERSVPGGGMIAGIGFVEGVRAMVLVDDAGIDAGAVQPMGIEKFQRAQQIALQQKLPFIHLVECAGANLLAYNVETFIHGGSGFYWLARLSAAGLPVISVVHGASTAGGAYMPGLSDYVIMVRGQAKAFLAGPPLLKAATGEIASEEELGGADMHAAVSGLADYVADDDAHALSLARQVVATLDWNRQVAPACTQHAAPVLDPQQLPGLAPAGQRVPLDMREIIGRIVDGSLFMEFKPDYGPATVTGHAAICGIRIGILANNGPLDPAGATKATQFIQLCCQSGTPLVYLQNTTGFMVGKAYEQAGMIKHGSKMIQAMANANVPRVTVHCGASFGAGNYGMSGRGFFPDFCFSWPNARTAVMGAEQAAGTMAIVMEAGMRRKGLEVDMQAIAAMREQVIATFEKQTSAFYTSGRLLDDGVIDPRDTRNVLAMALATCREAQERTLHPVQFGVARP